MEVAFPFLNDQMVAFSARLTPQQKLNGTQLRWFFKEALRGFLPDEIITKQKHGFGLPFGVWLQHHPPLQQLATDSLTDLKAAQASCAPSSSTSWSASTCPSTPATTAPWCGC